MAIIWKVKVFPASLEKYPATLSSSPASCPDVSTSHMRFRVETYPQLHEIVGTDAHQLLGHLVERRDPDTARPIEQVGLQDVSAHNQQLAETASPLMTYRWTGSGHFLSHFSHIHPLPSLITFLLHPSGLGQAGYENVSFLTKDTVAEVVK